MNCLVIAEQSTPFVQNVYNTVKSCGLKAELIIGESVAKQRLDSIPFHSFYPHIVWVRTGNESKLAEAGFQSNWWRLATMVVYQRAHKQKLDRAETLVFPKTRSIKDMRLVKQINNGEIKPSRVFLQRVCGNVVICLDSCYCGELIKLIRSTPYRQALPIDRLLFGRHTSVSFAESQRIWLSEEALFGLLGKAIFLYFNSVRRTKKQPVRETYSSILW